MIRWFKFINNLGDALKYNIKPFRQRGFVGRSYTTAGDVFLFVPDDLDDAVTGGSGTWINTKNKSHMTSCFTGSSLAYSGHPTARQAGFSAGRSPDPGKAQPPV